MTKLIHDLLLRNCVCTSLKLLIASLLYTERTDDLFGSSRFGGTIQSHQNVPGEPFCQSVHSNKLTHSDAHVVNLLTFNILFCINTTRLINTLLLIITIHTGTNANVEGAKIRRSESDREPDSAPIIRIIMTSGSAPTTTPCILLASAPE